MPVYHSSLNKAQAQLTCGASILPLKTKVKGNAPPARSDQQDIIDEAVDFFRANVLFRAFKCEGPADLTLCYLTIYISELLRFCQKYKKAEAVKNITSISMSGNFPIPGDKGFPLPGFFKNPESRTEADAFRAYYRQLREETTNRLLEIVYLPDGTPNKWWFSFAKRKFMNVEHT